MANEPEIGGESRRDCVFRAWAVVLLGLIDKQEKGELADGPVPLPVPTVRERRAEPGPAAEA